MQQQRGFTLIELIIVIVILGILAVTAAPKFIDIQGDATASTLQGVKAALQGGSQLVYAKAAIAGRQSNVGDGTSDSKVKIGNAEVSINLGYPDAQRISSSPITGWVDISASDFTVVPGATGDVGDTAATATTPGSGAFAIIPFGLTAVDYSKTGTEGASCHVIYTEATSNTTAIVTAVTGKC